MLIEETKQSVKIIVAAKRLLSPAESPFNVWVFDDVEEDTLCTGSLVDCFHGREMGNFENSSAGQ